MRHLKIAFLVGLLLGADVHGENRKKPDLPAPPPPVVETTITVTRGESTRIPLRIHGVRGGTLKYLIRTKPENGTISEPVQVTASTAEIVYTPNAKSGATADRLLYSVKSVEGVSAPGEIKIQIVEPEQKLSAPQELDFPETVTGHSTSRVFTVFNSGAVTCSGTLSMDAPWRIAGESDSVAYSLRPGESKEWTIEFRPREGGDAIGTLRFSGGGAPAIRLRGRAVDPLASDVKSLVLQSRVDGVRAASFTISNRTDLTMNVLLKGLDRLRFPAEIEIEGRSQVKVAVETDVVDVRELKGEIECKASGWSTVLPVMAAALPARLDVRPLILDLGMTLPKSEGAVELDNLGGKPTSVNIEVDGPWTVSLKQLTVAPLEKRTVNVRLADSAGVGRVSGALRILHTDGQTSSIVLRAEITNDLPRPSTGAAAPLSAPSAARVFSASAVSMAPAAPPPQEMGRPILATKVHSIGEDGCRFSFPFLGDPPERFLAQIRDIEVKGKTVEAVWKSHPHSVFRVEGKTVFGELAKLGPGRRFTVRILEPLDGQTGPTMTQFLFTTRIEKRLSWKAGSLWFGLAAILGAGAWVWMRREKRKIPG